jgi:hypothetical protein
MRSMWLTYCRSTMEGVSPPRNRGVGGAPYRKLKQGYKAVHHIYIYMDLNAESKHGQPEFNLGSTCSALPRARHLPQRRVHLVKRGLEPGAYTRPLISST